MHIWSNLLRYYGKAKQGNAKSSRRYARSIMELGNNIYSNPNSNSWKCVLKKNIFKPKKAHYYAIKNWI